MLSIPLLEAFSCRSFQFFVSLPIPTHVGKSAQKSHTPPQDSKQGYRKPMQKWTLYLNEEGR